MTKRAVFAVAFIFSSLANARIISYALAAAGDSLEILGAQGGASFRTNLALVELSLGMSATPARVKVEIFDEKGKLVDSFDTSVAIAGGIQLNDIFRERGLGDGPATTGIRVTPLNGLIGAYATMVDNGTNDPTYLAPALSSHE